jgi:hypothetical protein
MRPMLAARMRERDHKKLSRPVDGGAGFGDPAPAGGQSLGGFTRVMWYTDPSHPFGARNSWGRRLSPSPV